MQSPRVPGCTPRPRYMYIPIASQLSSLMIRDLTHSREILLRYEAINAGPSNHIRDRETGGSDCENNGNFRYGPGSSTAITLSTKDIHANLRAI